MHFRDLESSVVQPYSLADKLLLHEGGGFQVEDFLANLGVGIAKFLVCFSLTHQISQQTFLCLWTQVRNV